MSKSSAAVAAYLLAAVAANLSVAAFGQRALIVTALVLIPFDLTARDVLHERWRGKRLALRMAALVGGGALLSAVFSRGAARVALASFSAFACAGATDAAVFARFRGRSFAVRAFASNAASAVVDSLIFPMIAFGSLDPSLSAWQAGTKIVGGGAFAFAASKLRGNE